MRRFLFLVVLSTLTATAFAQSQPKPEILVLGTFHMANRGHDIYNIQADDVLSPKRQQELAEVVAVLKKFKPTKVAVEADVNDAKRVQKEYADYLAGNFTLTRDETQQVGFRLGKEMNLPTIYPVNADGDFPIQAVINYAKVNGKGDEFQKIMDGWGEMTKEIGDYLPRHTLLETLELANSDARATRDTQLYFQVLRYGDPWEYAGADLLSAYYQRNARIYTNIVRLIDSPSDRILVVYGYGHLSWLRNNVLNDGSVKLVKLADLTGKSQP